MPSREAPVETKVPALEVMTRERAAQSTKPCEAHSTARGDRSATAPRRGRAVLLLASAHVAQLSADLLRENPDQDELGRAWGDRRSA